MVPLLSPRRSAGQLPCAYSTSRPFTSRQLVDRRNENDPARSGPAAGIDPKTGGVTIVTRGGRQQEERDRRKPHQRQENQAQRQDRPPYDRLRSSDRDASSTTQDDYNGRSNRKHVTVNSADVNLRTNRQQGYDDDDEQVDEGWRGRDRGHFQEERWEHHNQPDPRQLPRRRRSSDHDEVPRGAAMGRRPSNAPGGGDRDDDRTTALSGEGGLRKFDQEKEGLFQLPRGRRRRSSEQERGGKGVEARSLPINPVWRRDSCVDDRGSQQGQRQRRRRSGDGDTVGYVDRDGVGDGAGEGGTYLRPSPPRGLLPASSHTVSPPRLQRLGMVRHLLLWWKIYAGTISRMT